MTVQLLVSYTASGNWVPVTVSGNYYQELLKSGSYLGKQLVELKLFDGDIFNFKDKRWKKGKGQ